MEDSNFNLDANIDKDLRDLIVQEEQRAAFQAQVHRLNDMCWDKCMADKISSKLESRQESCLTNCVERFIDASKIMHQRFAQLIEKQMQQ